MLARVSKNCCRKMPQPSIFKNMKACTLRTSVFLRNITPESMFTVRFDKNFYDKNLAKKKKKKKNYPGFAPKFCVLRKPELTIGQHQFLFLQKEEERKKNEMERS